MEKKLYVGNLPYSMNDQDLEAVFAAYGKVVSAKVIADYESKRSKGFGFVEMENEEDVSKAIEALNNKDINGRNIKVSIARPKVSK